MGSYRGMSRYWNKYGGGGNNDSCNDNDNDDNYNNNNNHNPIHWSDHTITAVSPTIAGSHPFICCMHRKNKQFIFFEIQFMCRFQESNVLCWCNCGSVDRGSNAVRGRIHVYLMIFYLRFLIAIAHPFQVQISHFKVILPTFIYIFFTSLYSLVNSFTVRKSLRLIPCSRNSRTKSTWLLTKA